MVIPSSVEEKIRYLLRKFPSTEWSGVLFYSHEGSFEEGNLTITCRDIYPMDLGNATFTQFSMSEDVAAYIANNIDLFECDLGLIHSHHSMSAFFSGTDLSTLQSEGSDTSCFVSLIVNNAGTYCAAVTRKIQTEQEIRNIGFSYEFFGEGTVASVDPASNVYPQSVKDTYIEYFMMDIDRQTVNNPLDYLDVRFDEIAQRKKEEEASKAHVNIYTKDSDDFDFYSWRKDKELKSSTKELPLFSEQTDAKDITPDDWTPDPNLIYRAVSQMLACSFILGDKFDLLQWVKRHMDTMYERIFPEGELAIDDWVDFIVEYQLNHFSDPTTPEWVLEDWDYYRSTLASAMYDEVSKYYDFSKYIHYYSAMLLRYANS